MLMTLLAVVPDTSSPDAIDLGLDAALPPVLDFRSQIGESGRGERARASAARQIRRCRVSMGGRLGTIDHVLGA
jgi:hypothetical protein